MKCDAVAEARLDLAKAATYLCQYSRHSVNFYLYIMINETLRKQTLAMLTPRCMSKSNPTSLLLRPKMQRPSSCTQLKSALKHTDLSSREPSTLDEYIPMKTYQS
jgi:hypothetical protein